MDNIQEFNSKNVYIVNKTDLKNILETNEIPQCENFENSKDKVYIVKEHNKNLETIDVKVLVVKESRTHKLLDNIEIINSLIQNDIIQSTKYKLGKVSIDWYLRKRKENISKKFQMENEKTKEKVVSDIIDEIHRATFENKTIKFSRKKEKKLQHFEEVDNEDDIVQKIGEIIEASGNNDILIISKKHNKIYLPYTIDELESYLRSYPAAYLTLRKVVEEEFVISYNSFYKNPSHTRFSEAYNLMKNREGRSSIISFINALIISGKKKLDPAIIAACKSKKELKYYLYCLKKNRLEDFHSFEIIYES